MKKEDLRPLRTAETLPLPPAKAILKELQRRIKETKARMEFALERDYSKEYNEYMEGRLAGLMEAASVARKQAKKDRDDSAI